MMGKRINMPLGESRVNNAELIIKLLVSGALKVGENGLCAGEPGVYEIFGNRESVEEEEEEKVWENK